MAKKVEFFAHEVAMTFIGALILVFGLIVWQAGITPNWLGWLMTILTLWLGLLVFIMPIVWKIEELI